MKNSKKFRNVLIKSIGTYFPKNKHTKEYYFEHFKKYNLERQTRQLIDELVRDNIYYMDEDETVITMAVQACKSALEKANLTVNDIDIIISASNTPEYLSPCCAILVQQALKSNAKMCMDVNCDCISMLHGFNVGASLLKTLPYKRALVIGSFAYNRFSLPDNIITYGTVSDNSTAMVLEVAEEDTQRGFIDSETSTDSRYTEFIRFPGCGFSNLYKDDVKKDDKKLVWDNFNSHWIPKDWVTIINTVCNRNDIKSNNITHYFLSQFSLDYIKEAMDRLNIKDDRFSFVADKYGYTGPSSPFMGFYDYLLNNSFNEGDTSIFCSVSAGCSMTAILYRW